MATARESGSFDLILPFLAPIRHLIEDATISEIMVVAGRRVFIERDGLVSPVPNITVDERQLLTGIKIIARSLGDEISDAKPILDSRLPDGSRVAAMLPPCSVDGITLTIRKFESWRMTLEGLIETGFITVSGIEVLRDRIASRQNILISGGTGTGKTTLLGILAGLIPNDDRIILIEDTAEIQLSKLNLVRFEARHAQPRAWTSHARQGETQGTAWSGLPAVTIRDLVRASLRHRPDRLIVGEIRGEEAYDLIQALNTGHSGSLSTIHANSARQAITRLASCVLQSALDIPHRVLQGQIADSIQVVVHLDRTAGTRRVAEMIELTGYDHEADRPQTNYLYTAG